MYVPPDEPVKGVGEVNISYQQDMDGQFQYQSSEAVDGHGGSNIDVSPSTSTAYETNTSSVNPIYQRY